MRIEILEIRTHLKNRPEGFLLGEDKSLSEKFLNSVNSVEYKFSS